MLAFEGNIFSQWKIDNGELKLSTVHYQFSIL